MPSNMLSNITHCHVTTLKSRENEIRQRQVSLGGGLNQYDLHPTPLEPVFLVLSSLGAKRWEFCNDHETLDQVTHNPKTLRKPSRGPNILEPRNSLGAEGEAQVRTMPGSITTLQNAQDVSATKQLNRRPVVTLLRRSHDDHVRLDQADLLHPAHKGCRNLVQAVAGVGRCRGGMQSPVVLDLLPRPHAPEPASHTTPPRQDSEGHVPLYFLYCRPASRATFA